MRHRRRSAAPQKMGATGPTPHRALLGDHIRQNVIGAVAPQSGELFTLIVDGVGTDVFQCFLDEFAKAVPQKAGVQQLVIVDNASWHKSSRLNWHHFEPKFLPGYSPEPVNPIERLWLRLKADWFWDFIARTQAELTDRLCTAIKAFLANPTKTASHLLHPEMIYQNHSVWQPTERVVFGLRWQSEAATALLRNREGVGDGCVG
ncbi:MAG: transposase [Verrucomicrobiota bacterium]